MDAKQLSIEYMSIMTESHPGLTFEEYRDCTAFLLMYKYCCLRYKGKLDDTYQHKELVRMAIRGKLQIPSFLKFMESASSFIHMLGCPFRLMDLSFGRQVTGMLSQEKQKSFARYIRKLIKKVDSWDSDDLLYENFPGLFSDLLTHFARSKKETHISDGLLSLYRFFFDSNGEGADEPSLFVPGFQYGLLFNAMRREGEEAILSGYDSEIVYLEMFQMLCFMNHVPGDKCFFYQGPEWTRQDISYGTIDRIAVFMPEGMDGGELMAEPEVLPWDKDLFSSRTKGELPFVLSALPFLKEDGCMTAVFPSALLYREGKETQIRRYLIDELNCLDTVVLLPDSLFMSAGQQEVLLYFKRGRDREDVMLFDCSDVSGFGQDDLDRLSQGLKKRESVPGYSACATHDEMVRNDYNLNLPRYISKTEKEIILDLNDRRSRIAEIDRELKEIDEQIAMYKRALEL